MLKQLTPRRLDELLLTSAATRYADKLKLRSACITSTAVAASQFAQPPKHCSIKPSGLTYAAVTAKPSTSSGILNSTQAIPPTVPNQPMTQTA